MAGDINGRGISRRSILVGGGVGVGLLVGLAVWPRSYDPKLSAAPGEHIFNAFLKIGTDRRVTVVVPQVEMGQGTYTALPQIVADELGADWRSVGVEAAPVSPVYANRLFAGEWLESWPRWAADEAATRTGMMVTGHSTSVRGFEERLREAGAAARVLLCMAAAARWDADWQACDTANGFVTRGEDRLPFGAVVADAAGLSLPDTIPRRTENRLTGQSLPRLDVPSKVDGSVQYAADVRLPRMVFASIAQGPLGDTRLRSIDRSAADKIAGVVSVVETERWVAAVASNWWAADRAVEAMLPIFETTGTVSSDASITTALDDAFENGERIVSIGNVAEELSGPGVITAEYSTGLAPHAAIEPTSATADLEDGVMQIWIGTQVPWLAAQAAARAIGIDAANVIVHPMMIGGSFGRRYEVEIAGQVALLAARLKRPVQLTWSRAEDMRQDRFRPAAAARMSARLAPGGRIDSWLAKIAAPATSRQVEARAYDGDSSDAAMRAHEASSDASSIAGAVPPYAIPNYSIDHHPAELGIPTGHWRGRGHGTSAFFTECFIDELAAASGVEPFSFRMGLLVGNPRLARCLAKVAALGKWQGGSIGTGQGLACHSMAGSYIAVLAEADIASDGQVRVTRIFAVADCGRVINPSIVRQQVAGGLIFGMSAATGVPVHIDRGLAGPTRLGALRLPVLANAPAIVIELVSSSSPPGGAGEIAVPPVAPAIANALFAGSGKRHRTLPLVEA